MRAVDGWTPVHIVAECGGRVVGALLLLIKRLPALPFSIFCAPHGPLCEPGDGSAFRAIHRKVVDLARHHRAIFLRIDPNILETDARRFEAIAGALGYRHLEQRWSFWNSPRDEYRIDLTAHATVDELHQALHRDTRRCIRKGPKDGLVMTEGRTEDDLRAFYALFRDFSVGKGFLARGYDYQRRLWQCYVARGRGRLFLATYEGRIVGGLICIAFARKCVAMHMGTLYEYQRLQPNYACIWESLRWAKENGCEWYSFRGVGTTPTQEAFKRKFNPTVVSLAGYFDRPFNPLLYRLFYWAEFTLLPYSWPWIVKSRKLASSALRRLRRPQAER